MIITLDIQPSASGRYHLGYTDSAGKVHLLTHITTGDRQGFLTGTREDGTQVNVAFTGPHAITMREVI